MGKYLGSILAHGKERGMKNNLFLKRKLLRRCGGVHLFLTDPINCFSVIFFS
jgi:hypothetical protein